MGGISEDGEREDGGIDYINPVAGPSARFTDAQVAELGGYPGVAKVMDAMSEAYLRILKPNEILLPEMQDLDRKELEERYATQMNISHTLRNKLMVIEAELEDLRAEKGFPKITIAQMEQIADLKRRNRLINYDFDKGEYTDGGDRDSGQSIDTKDSVGNIKFKDDKGVTAVFFIPLELHNQFDIHEIYELREAVLTSYRTKLRDLIDKHRS